MTTNDLMTTVDSMATDLDDTAALFTPRGAATSPEVVTPSSSNPFAPRSSEKRRQSSSSSRDTKRLKVDGVSKQEYEEALAVKDAKISELEKELQVALEQRDTMVAGFAKCNDNRVDIYLLS